MGLSRFDLLGGRRRGFDRLSPNGWVFGQLGVWVVGTILPPFALSLSKGRILMDGHTPPPVRAEPVEAASPR
jgi:hypothetical protein